MTKGADTVSIPHRCPQCLANDCYHGILAWSTNGRTIVPSCDHHKPPGKPCHPKPVKMEPVVW